MINMAEVCEENRGLVYHIAKRYISACRQDRAADIDDLAQAGYIGLIEAVKTFDESKGVFSTWAAMYVQAEMRKTLGLHRHDPRADQGALSLDAPVLDGEAITLADTVEAPENVETATERAELVQAVRATVDALPVPQNEIVRRHDLRGQSVTAAGVCCGLTASAAQNAYHRGRDRLSRDAALRALAAAHHLDRRTNWHRHVTLDSFRRTWTSSTEALVFWREQHSR
ncbi:MAG: sigma-70 family RNA polymerase sigma factor [Eubacteriales bacterium]|nr:sigma-70 family RNA polymerase sigma factor [Eubacteriales bacterium]